MNYIKLISISDCEIFINMSKVYKIFVSENECGTVIIAGDGIRSVVKETPEQIFKAMCIKHVEIES